MKGSEKVREVIERNNRFLWFHHIQPLVTSDTIEEHRRDPFGHHSVELDMLLAFVRSDPLPSQPQYVVMCVRPEQEWVIGEHSRTRGVPVIAPDDSERFKSVEDAEHAIFLRRIADLEREFSQ
jgi:branched-chain amino acid transport system permease protein